jgi:hypothetical protein
MSGKPLLALVLLAALALAGCRDGGGQSGDAKSDSDTIRSGAVSGGGGGGGY